jgi:hypothetical protein
VASRGESRVGAEPPRGSARSAAIARYLLTLADGTTAPSAEPGRLGGNRVSKIYGRLDCASAIRALPRGYAKRRVFFTDEATAVAAGYRPCAVCMREAYRRWKAGR